ncbi:MAG: 4-hydroxy-tetrahydrodipicolinate synthase [Deltaproteobacteria bacterium]|nr:4-hydroxy-tetrahydrodipicolinate synthase [Deltaproteobacteria bacterium]
MFEGAFSALVTPFKDNQVDEEALRGIIGFQISKGINGLVPCGTTGESATLTYEEHKKVIEITVDAADGRVPVIAGAGSNSTAETIDLAAHAKKAGAHGALLITPYYNKPTQEGLYLHYKSVAQAVDLPLVLYNVPGRTCVNMLPETSAKLSAIENIVGIKEATADMEQISWLKKLCRDQFSILSGDDATVLPMMTLGGRGVISVVSNVVPGEMAALCRACLDGDRDKALDIHYRLLPLTRALFSETNPIPVKEAIHMMGLMSDEVRLPLTRLPEDKRPALSAVLKELDVI